MITELATIGYEGSNLADFVATLNKCGIQLLLDIRELPLSRKKGFSKNGLAEALANAGVEYVHIKSLGDPKPGRLAARNGDFDSFRRIFGAHLQTDDAQTGLALAARLVREKRAVLLCFERDHCNCHRAIVAERLSQETGLPLRHLGVRAGIALDGVTAHEGRSTAA
ncbi:MAG: DUF488 domain-containing protein [Pseudomonadota bacterium]